MHKITDAASFARALDSPIGEAIKALLRLRRDQLLVDDPHLDIGDVAQFIVIEQGDTVAVIEAAAGYPVVTTQAFEWVADHGGLLEGTTIFDDDGFAMVLICADDDSVDAELLALLRELAEPAAPLAVGHPDQGRATAA